ncbi:MAG: hydroxymethylglutaryl-CoA lyase [Candidatus Limnocylindria bacterium]
MTAEPGPSLTAEPGPADRRVRVYEVGPRDGLQNEAVAIPTATKARFIELLLAAGLREIEATSFVSPTAVPQLADAEALLAAVAALPGAGAARLPVLVANERGMARAEAAARATGATDAIAVFTAATDAFTTANIGMTVDQSIEAFAPILARAGELGWWRRAYVSTAFGCPYQGRVDPADAVAVARRLLDLGADELCFGDTIGVGVPDQVAELVALAEDAGIPVQQQAYHFHDTRGTALANVAMGLAAGVRTFDSSTGGTGGCPYAPGAAGNLATEDLVYLLDASGWDHGVALDGVLAAAAFIADAIGRPLASKVGQAGGWAAIAPA